MLNAYYDRAITTQKVTEELIKLAKEISAVNQRGIDLGRATSKLRLPYASGSGKNA